MNVAEEMNECGNGGQTLEWGVQKSEEPNTIKTSGDESSIDVPSTPDFAAKSLSVPKIQFSSRRKSLLSPGDCSSAFLAQNALLFHGPTFVHYHF